MKDCLTSVGSRATAALGGGSLIFRPFLHSTFWMPSRPARRRCACAEESLETSRLNEGGLVDGGGVFAKARLPPLLGQGEEQRTGFAARPCQTGEHWRYIATKPSVMHDPQARQRRTAGFDRNGAATARTERAHRLDNPFHLRQMGRQAAAIAMRTLIRYAPRSALDHSLSSLLRGIQDPLRDLRVFERQMILIWP